MTQTNLTQKAMFCCIAGTLIRTPQGDRPVESLRPGDLVETFDGGSQSVTLVGSAQVAATGEAAPICLRAGTLGPHGPLFVSPLHRFMIRDSLAAMLFGDAEVLVAARDLVNGRSVTRLDGGLVDYQWLGFPVPQLIYAHGLITGSFPCSLADFATSAAGPMPNPDDTSPVHDLRRVLRRFEAQVLMTAAA